MLLGQEKLHKQGGGKGAPFLLKTLFYRYLIN